MQDSALQLSVRYVWTQLLLPLFPHPSQQLHVRQMLMQEVEVQTGSALGSGVSYVMSLCHVPVSPVRQEVLT